MSWVRATGLFLFVFCALEVSGGTTAATSPHCGLQLSWVGGLSEPLITANFFAEFLPAGRVFQGRTFQQVKSEFGNPAISSEDFARGSGTVASGSLIHAFERILTRDASATVSIYEIDRTRPLRIASQAWLRTQARGSGASGQYVDWNQIIQDNDLDLLASLDGTLIATQARVFIPPPSARHYLHLLAQTLKTYPYSMADADSGVLYFLTALYAKAYAHFRLEEDHALLPNELHMIVAQEMADRFESEVEDHDIEAARSTLWVASKMRLSFTPSMKAFVREKILPLINPHQTYAIHYWKNQIDRP